MAEPLGTAELPQGELLTTVDRDEVERFQRLAADWWDEDGPFRPLHLINELRLGFIREQLVRHFGREAPAVRPFQGLRLLDVGCGGGLVAEPMTRMGFTVTAIDAEGDSLAVARSHAAAQGLEIEYREAAIEDIHRTGEQFDALLALEVVEHVTDVGDFVEHAAALVRPGGVIVFSTLNRTLKSFGLGIVMAELVLGWLPCGTHDWRKFVKPSELARHARRAGLQVADLTGMSYSPLAREWGLGRDLGVNYMMVASKPA